MSVDLMESPCRKCSKQHLVTCRKRCKRLSAYQKESITFIPVHNYGEQYDGELFGLPRLLPRILAGTKNPHVKRG